MISLLISVFFFGCIAVAGASIVMVPAGLCLAVSWLFDHHYLTRQRWIYVLVGLLTALVSVTLLHGFG